MLPITRIPKLVEHYSSAFESLFRPESFMYFQRYLTGLILSENKTVEAMNRFYVVSPRHQCSFNRFLNTHAYDLDAINNKRLCLLQQNSTTAFKKASKMSRGGVLSFDDTLLEHYGKHMDHIGYIWDHSKHCYVLAHNVVNFYYSDDQTDYPINFEFKIPVNLEVLEQAMEQANIHMNATHRANKLTEQKKWRTYLLKRWGVYQKNPILQKAYRSKLVIAKDMLTDFCLQYPDLNLPVSFDSWFTKPWFCKYIDEELNLAFVGGLTTKEQIILKGGEKKSLEDFVKQLKSQHHKDNLIFKKTTFNYKDKKITYYIYHGVHRIKNFGKKNLMVSFSKEDLSDKVRLFICNRHHWHAKRMAFISRHRWPVEVFHQEGKAEGLDKYQLRNFVAINRHYAMVVLVYSILQIARTDKPFLEQLHDTFKEDLDGSIANWRRKLKADNLVNFVSYLLIALKNGRSVESILHPFLSAIAY